MKIAVIGTGYVGLPTGICLAELGNDVICIDKDENKIATIKHGESPIFEKDMDELLANNIKSNNLRFSTDISVVADAEIILVAVGTPCDDTDGSADLSYLFAAIQELAPHLQQNAIIAIKSTVPVGTGDKAEAIVKEVNPELNFHMVSLPEFLRQGFAVHDFFNPDRIVIGTNSIEARTKLKQLYSFFENKCPILCVERQSSELIKYAANSFLAIKVHFANELSDFCEQTTADISEVMQGVGSDKRIGNKFLNPGPGYGGSCFPKDTKAMLHMAKQKNINLSLVEKTIIQNEERKKNIAKKIISYLPNKENNRLAILGLAFKGETDDCRDSPAMDVIFELLKHNVNIIAYDPEAIDSAKKILGNKIEYANNYNELANNADILISLTDWPEFSEIKISDLLPSMNNKIIMDFRRILDLSDDHKEAKIYKIGQGKV